MHNVCPVCDVIRDNPGLTNSALGRLANTTESSIRRHKAHESLPIETVDPFFSVPNSAITSRGASIRTEDGSWQKISYNPNKVAAEQAFTYDDVDRAIQNYTGFGREVTDGGETLVVCAADFQIGKTDDGGGTQDTINRVMNVYAQIKEYAVARSFNEIVFADLGDSTEGFWNTITQAQTNDLNLTDQIRVAQRLLVEGIKTFAPLTAKLTYVAVSSNHCSVRTAIGNKNRADVPGDDFGLLIQDNIALYLSERPEFSHVGFIKPTRHEESVVHETVDGTRVGFTHGHLANSQTKLPDWYAGQIAGRRSGLDASDLLVTGHWHSAYLSEAADGRPVIGAPTIDNGSSWFSNTSGKSSKPGMLTFKLNKGEMNGWRIWRP